MSVDFKNAKVIDCIKIKDYDSSQSGTVEVSRIWIVLVDKNTKKIVNKYCQFYINNNTDALNFKTHANIVNIGSDNTIKKFDGITVYIEVDNANADSLSEKLYTIPVYNNDGKLIGAFENLNAYAADSNARTLYSIEDYRSSCYYRKDSNLYFCGPNYYENLNDSRFLKQKNNPYIDKINIFNNKVSPVYTYQFSHNINTTDLKLFGSYGISIENNTESSSIPQNATMTVFDLYSTSRFKKFQLNCAVLTWEILDSGAVAIITKYGHTLITIPISILAGFNQSENAQDLKLEPYCNNIIQFPRGKASFYISPSGLITANTLEGLFLYDLKHCIKIFKVNGEYLDSFLNSSTLSKNAHALWMTYPKDSFQYFQYSKQFCIIKDTTDNNKYKVKYELDGQNKNNDFITTDDYLLQLNFESESPNDEEKLLFNGKLDSNEGEYGESFRIHISKKISIVGDGLFDIDLKSAVLYGTTEKNLAFTKTKTIIDDYNGISCIDFVFYGVDNDITYIDQGNKAYIELTLNNESGNTNNIVNNTLITVYGVN